MLRLCALLLDRDRAASDFGAFDADAETVFQAIQWHRNHLADGSSVNAVAAALHLSPDHLRRLFLRVHPRNTETRLPPISISVCPDAASKQQPRPPARTTARDADRDELCSGEL